MDNQVLDSDFAKALDCIESPDPETRRMGAARLEKIGGNRSYQVAGVLVGDADPVVASIARRICAGQRNAGILWRSHGRPVRPAEQRPVQNGWQLLDEIIFICRRNLSELSFTAFVAALPKLFFVFAAFAGPFLFANFKQFFAVEYIVFAVLLHQIFWRPLVWLSVGKAFLGGFPDRMTRLQAKTNAIWGNYLAMLVANLPAAVGFSVVAALILPNLLGRNDVFEQLLILAGFWLAIWEPFFFTTSGVLVRGGLYSMPSAIALRFSMKPSIIKANIFFIFTLGCLYLLLYTSTVAAASFLGVSLQTADIDFPQQVWYLSLLVAADCILEPFIIGYRILLFRLCSEVV